MEAKFSDIDSDIKNNNFSNIYLLYGDESYLVRQYKHKLIGALVAEGDVMNFASYEGKDIEPNELIDLAGTMPMFAEHRVILVEDSGFFKKSCEELSTFFKEKSLGSTVFIFSESEVDKRGKLYKSLGEAGKSVEFATPDEATLSKWMLSKLKREDMSITRDAMKTFLDMCGGNMEIIDTESEKLICSCLDKGTIEVDDVRDVVTTQTENHIFDMIDALANLNKKRAFLLYSELLELKEAPMRILFLIARQFNMLLMIKKMNARGIPVPEMAKKLGTRDFVVRKNLKVVGRFKEQELKDYVVRCVETEQSVKSGLLNEQIAVELLLT